VPSRHEDTLMQAARVLVVATVPIIMFAATVLAVEVRKAGKLSIPANIPLLAFSTDPTVQEVLSQDLSAARRGGATVSRSPMTLTVTVTDELLQPGASLEQLAPGDPQVAELIKAAGATPPPLGDTGNKYDEAALARRMAEHEIGRPRDNPMQQMISQLGGPGNFGPPLPCDQRSLPIPGCAPAAQETPKPKPGSPGYTGDVDQYMAQGRRARRVAGGSEAVYDTVIVARVTVSGAPDEMTVVAVTHPGEDAHEAKKLVAEEIVNAVLH
jgi:hypothetical protein